jgi:hypothetical protein
MGLAEAWRRRLYASVALAVLAPAALLVTLALLAVGDGSFSLASLGQAVSGPSAPPTVAAPALGLGPGSRSGRPTARSPGSSVAGGTLLAAAPGPGRGVSTKRGGSPFSHPRGGTGGGGGGRGGSGGGGGSGGSGGPHHPRSPAHGTAVDRIVGTVTPVTSALPAPVGPVATQVVKTVGSVGDQVLKHLP